MWLKYADKPLTKDDLKYPYIQEPPSSYSKPVGFWFTDETAYNWKNWCLDNKWGLSRLTHKHQILLSLTNILVIKNLADLDTFNRKWLCDITYRTGIFKKKQLDMVGIDWSKVAEQYQGIIISPYQWERRLEYSWYYSWDCSSGCVWDYNAIKDIRLIEVDMSVAVVKEEQDETANSN